MKKNHSLSRRNFVGKLAASTLGAAISVDSFALTSNKFDLFDNLKRPSNGKKVRIGIVGGGFGANFYWHEHPDCIVAAVTDLEPKRRKKLQQVYKCDNVYNSMEEMLRKAKDLDAVGIFTEAPNHFRHSVAALKAGKHVICAVPTALSLEDNNELVNIVKETGLIYMMAETSYWQQSTISARKFFKNGEFGDLIHVDSMYQHPGLSMLGYRNGKKTWRYGLPPMLYPTHCTAHYVGVTGGRLTEVVCHGWGNDQPFLKDNIYNNPFSNQTAMFKTENGKPFNVRRWDDGAFNGAERAEWIGEKMSFYGHTPNGQGPIIIRGGNATEKDDGGFIRTHNEKIEYQQPEWYLTDMLPKPLQHKSGHEGSHTFITHEFIDSIVRNRKPAVDIYESVAYTVPGIVAHQSALKGGELLKIPNFDPS